SSTNAVFIWGVLLNGESRQGFITPFEVKVVGYSQIQPAAVKYVLRGKTNVFISNPQGAQFSMMGNICSYKLAHFVLGENNTMRVLHVVK
ncbi:MAG: hypothetical protein N2487_05495, partial [Verrucomicrobiae bacterium]|nr:hypothetical protein [Verrucomicrobiae bacterium]